MGENESNFLISSQARRVYNLSSLVLDLDSNCDRIQNGSSCCVVSLGGRYRRKGECEISRL